MNETGMTLGVLYLPGFVQYQEMVAGEEATSAKRGVKNNGGF
jgi:penicillin V acylase-like amidase (Ntn superfamily)